YHQHAYPAAEDACRSGNLSLPLLVHNTACQGRLHPSPRQHPACCAWLESYVATAESSCRRLSTSEWNQPPSGLYSVVHIMFYSNHRIMMTGTYRHTPITEERNIRILQLQPASQGSQLQCKLLEVSLDDAPKYRALSYVWSSGPSVSYSL
ncbi:uncharacterized protein BDZ99DRAFT_531680, partial [Mytilinidion resinicola]